MTQLPRERILEATDIVALISERIALKKAGKEFVGLCPFHNDRKPSLNVNPAKGIFKCFACGAGGDAIKFVQLYEKLEFRDALQYLADRAGLGHLRETRGATDGGRGGSIERDQLRSVLNWAAQHFQRNLRDAAAGRAAYEYAIGRGMKPETVEKFRLGYALETWDDLSLAATRAGIAPEVLEAAGLVSRHEAGRLYDRFRNRLMFPIHDPFGRVIAFGGRTMGDDPAKYLNSPESALFSKSRVLYGFDLARKSFDAEKSAIVVEGYVDALMLAQAGYGQAVATLGTALTDSHVKLLAPHVERVFLCFDGDAAGQKAADRACEVALRSDLDVRVVVLPAGKDPADLVSEDDKIFNNNLQDAKSALHFKWEQTRAHFASAGPSGQRQAIDVFLAFIAKLADSRSLDPVQQGLLVSRLADLLELPSEPVYQMLASARRSHRRASVAGAGPAATELRAEAAGALPEGLVRCVEELLGLLVCFPACMHQVDDIVLRGLSLMRDWQALYDQMLNLLDEQGAYSSADVIARCDEVGLLELTGRLNFRTSDESEASESFALARERLAAEFELQDCRDAARNLRGSVPSDDADEALRRLIGAGRQESAIPMHYRLREWHGR